MSLHIIRAIVSQSHPLLPASFPKIAAVQRSALCCLHHYTQDWTLGVGVKTTQKSSPTTDLLRWGASTLKQIKSPRPRLKRTDALRALPGSPPRESRLSPQVGEFRPKTQRDLWAHLPRSAGESERRPTPRASAEITLNHALVLCLVYFKILARKDRRRSHQ